MAVIAKLRPDVDAFFDKVTVNVEMADRRENRLKLLNEIREATRAVADFSKIGVGRGLHALFRHSRACPGHPDK